MKLSDLHFLEHYSQIRKGMSSALDLSFVILLNENYVSSSISKSNEWISDKVGKREGREEWSRKKEKVREAKSKLKTNPFQECYFHKNKLVLIYIL